MLDKTKKADWHKRHRRSAVWKTPSEKARGLSGNVGQNFPGGRREGMLPKQKASRGSLIGLVQPLIASALRTRDHLSLPFIHSSRACSGQSYLSSLDHIM